ncbi:MAG: YmdB family metallophosphoesterase [Planctomycetes bacterium]|nr:YmdB family metallophosphoesterase [Planctomycetota bacterium]MCW8136540.1 YmdB family metallophosphoesterase [Planctomycetota bacterium]
MPDTSIRILCLGDLVGRPGRRVIRECLPAVRRDHAIDFVIVNIENATNGAGVREKEAAELLGYGIDCMTSGDHVLDFPDVYEYLRREPRLLRPHNYDIPGTGAHVYQTPKGPVGVVNVVGHVFMKDKVPTRNAFKTAEAAVGELRQRTPVVLVDIHGEATSEKIGMGWLLDGKASAVFGTHTHVQTADAQVLPGGTGFLTDLGMTGPHFGVIGRDKDTVLKRFRDEEKAYMRVAKQWIRMTGAIFDINTGTGRCNSVELFSKALPDSDSEN